MNLHFPLRHSIPAIMLATGIAVLAAAYGIESNALNRNLSQLADQQLRSTATFVAAGMEAAFRDQDEGAARATIERAISNRQVKLVFLEGPQDIIRYASNPAWVGNTVTGVEQTRTVRDALDHGDDTLVARILPLNDAGTAAGSFPVQMRGVEQDFMPNEFGKLYLVYDISVYAEQQRYELLQRMAWRAVILAILVIAFWVLFRWLLLRRIGKLVASVRSVGKGDFSSEPDIHGRDELAELGRELTGMMRQLRLHTEQTTYLADHDQLTGLLNRHGFEQEVERAQCYTANQAHAVCLLDIDSLRVVNDTRGHMAGDELLRTFAGFLSASVENAVAGARVGGDEFALLLQVADDNELDASARALQATIREFRFAWGEDRFSVQVSMGLVLLGPGIENAEEALSLADTACYAAKEDGHGRIAIWRAGNEEWLRKHGQMRWVSRIQHALDENRFRLYAQTISPLSALASHTGLRIEILVRMVDENDELLPPGDFLGAAERYNLVGKIDRWVIRETLNWLESNPASRNAIEMCSINLSGLSFGDKDLLNEISNALSQSTNVQPGKICFEVTETAAITNLGHAREFIDSLRDMGCSFALDDFGSGVSSFGYLKNLPVDYIKIDGMFVRDMVDDSTDRAIVSSINNIAQEMGMKTIAEFVENNAIVKMLRELGVDYAQGFGISKPEPLEDVAGPAAVEKRKRA